MVRIVSFKRINEFSEKNGSAKIALAEWYYKTKASNWDNLIDIKQTFRTADYVGNNRFVFNIKGNNFRLVAIVIFASQKVYIRFIVSHAEYDKINARSI